MLGGDNLFFAGPCYQTSDVIVSEFAGGKRSKGSYISSIRASCTVPMLHVTGRLSFKMSVNGGTSFDFQGVVTIGKILEEYIYLVEFPEVNIRIGHSDWSKSLLYDAILIPLTRAWLLSSPSLP